MPKKNPVPNKLFWKARQRLNLSRSRLADDANGEAAMRTCEHAPLNENYIGRIEQGRIGGGMCEERVSALCARLGVADPADIGLVAERRLPTRSAPARRHQVLRDVSAHDRRLDERQAAVPDEHSSEQVSVIHANPGRYLPDPVGLASHWADNAEVLRRTVLWALSAAAGGAVVGDRVQNPPPFGAGQPPMMAAVDHWREVIWEYGYSYHVAAREELLPDLCADVDAIKRQLVAQLAVGDVETKPIAAVASQLVALTAMSCTDLGYAREGRHLWRFARSYADMSGDTAVQQWTKGHEITSGIYQQRPSQALANLAEQALVGHGNSSPSAGKAELLGGQAQLLSLMGRTREAQTALNRLRDTYEQLPTAVTSLSDSILGWPEQRLRHAESFTSSITGPTPDAYQAQERALALYAPTRPISRCQIELHRARCLIRDGHIGDGLRHASAALASVDLSRRKEFVLATADHVLDAVPPNQRSRPEAREFGDLVTAARSTPHP